MADHIAIVLAAITTLTTVVLGFLNWRYVKLTQQMLQVMESSQEPYVDITVGVSHTTELTFTFSNTGGTAARNVTFHVQKDCKKILGIGDFSSGGIAAMPPLINGISYLPSQQQLTYCAGVLRHESIDFGDKLTISISYSNDAKRLFDRKIEYQLHQLKHVKFSSFRNNLVSVSEAIRDAARELK